jgi:lysozyme family protein
MADAFDTAFAELIGLEGKYSNDERDPGNWTGGEVGKGQLKGTMYGISAASYPDLDIAGLSLYAAKNIYRRDFWDRLRCDALPAPVAIALFKEGVNLGAEGAAKALQRSLRATADGSVGNITIGLALSHPPKEVVEEFLTECAYLYTQMDNFKVDGKGWLSRVIKTASEASYE